MNVTFKRVNSIAGWVIFAIASIVYLLTMEPTASFWDCGEFIASSYKLEVGHPPGNPVFQLIGRIFSMFMPAQYVAPAVNASSALCSSATILLLFWSITHIARRLMERKGESFTMGNIIAIIGTGTVGALVYTFSDTFWFSAVEAEVYAMSSLFTAVVFWAILKWEEEADKPHAARWLILIAYLMGLSIGVHLLNLLTIPAIVFIFYFKKYKVSTKGMIGALLIAGALTFLMLGFIPAVPRIAAYVDLFFVNVLGAPFNVGMVFAVLALMGLAVFGMIYARRRKLVAWHSAFLMFIVAMIGYSTFAMVVIRSSANPPTNENQPDNPFALLYYLNREQYGSAPLLSGPSFASRPIEYVDKHTYIKDGNKYRKVKAMPDYEYDTRYNMFFPRMHSLDKNHRRVYESYVNPNRRNVVRDPNTDQVIPSFGENLGFFFDYQINWMYFRYFMWNFAGRQNDIQGFGNSYHGNWECGIPFIDKLRLGDMSDLPPYLAENKARNHYYMLPLILGIIGLLYQYRRDKRNFVVVFLLFFLTGLAIIVYLNQTPMQPRERDYAYAGSFYAFAIWIGLGVYAIYDFLRNLKMPAVRAAAISSAVCVVVPIQMAAVNWDDHDRSDRYFARDVAYNYLNSCDKDAILFTSGDNDTFPLWYAQEVEGVRTDIRVVNLSLIMADWYIDQMKRRQYEADPVPFTIHRDYYLTGVNDMIPIHEVLKTPQSVETVIEFLTNPKYFLQTRRGDAIGYVPTRNITVPVNKEMLLERGIIPKKSADRILDTMTISISKDEILKSDMMILDLLKNNNWKRPVHFISMGSDIALELKNYYQYEGFTHKLAPLKPGESRDLMGIMVDADDLYDKLIHTFRWTNMDKPGIFIDHNLSLTLTQLLSIRNMHVRAAGALMQEGKNEKAKEVLDSLMKRMPTYNFPCNISGVNNDYAFMTIINQYYRLGEHETAEALAREFLDATTKNVRFFSKRYDADEDFEMNLYYLQHMASMLRSYNEELSKEFYNVLIDYIPPEYLRDME